MTSDILVSGQSRITILLILVPYDASSKFETVYCVDFQIESIYLLTPDPGNPANLRKFPLMGWKNFWTAAGAR